MAKKSTSKKVIKSAKKMAKKNPAGFAIAVVLVIFLVAAGVGGYFLYKHFNPTVNFKLKGKEKVSVAIGTEYQDKGWEATYNGKDIADKVKVSYYLNGGLQYEIKTDSIKDYVVKYELNYEKYSGTLERKVRVTDVEEISINFLELGNEFTGDATFIKAGETDILIDAGSRQNSATTISKFIDKYCEDGSLEYVIATHAHQDHIAGFVGSKANPGIFEKYHIDTLIDFALTNTDSQIYKDYVSIRDSRVASGDIAHHYTAQDCVSGNGVTEFFEVAAGITMEILDQRFYREKTKDENDYSVCALFTQGSNNYLFTGDLEAEGEASLVALNNLPEVELFKGGHHGSYTANTDTLLNVIKPKTVCICCCAGSDEYTKDPNSLHNFPAQEAVDRIAPHTDKIFVTTMVDDEKKFKSMNGDITFYSEKGKEYTVTGSNNSVILKDTDWFKANRTWPTY